jgi:EmrB/QacA subfamily drug resistance transporter
VWPRKHRKAKPYIQSIDDETGKSRSEARLCGPESIASCGLDGNDRAMAKNSALPSGARATTAAGHRKGTLAATILASSLAFIDGSVVNVGLPAIERDLASSGASGASIGWLVSGYLLPLGALLLLGGVAGDRYGRKKMLLAGMALFSAASLACALAPGFAWLLAARAAQGIGAALLMPASLAILGAAFSGEARGRAVGTWAAAGAVCGAIGPLAGGWLIDVVGWRSIFLVNLPIAALAGWLAWRYVDESRSDDAAPLDIGGAFFATVGLGLVTYGLTLVAAHASATTSTNGGGSATVGFFALGAGVLALIAFVVLESRLGRHAMMPLHLFGTATFVGVSILTLGLYAALGGMIVLLPYLLIRSGGYSAAAAGAALLPLSIAMGLGSRAAGRLAERIGARVLLTVGPIVVALGFLLFLRVGTGVIGYATVLLPALVVVACGLTLSVAPLTAAAMGAVDAAHVGSASGVNNAIARIGGLLATALLGFVLAGDASGPAFVARFHGAATCGALLALAAGIAAFALVRGRGRGRGRRGRGRRSRRVS